MLKRSLPRLYYCCCCCVCCVLCVTYWVFGIRCAVGAVGAVGGGVGVGSDNSGRAVSMQGLAPMMQQINGPSPRESETSATAPAPTLMAGPKKTCGNMERANQSPCNTVAKKGSVRSTQNSDKERTQDRTRPRRWHPTWRGVDAKPPLHEGNAEVTDERAHDPSSDTEGEENSECPEAAKHKCELTPGHYTEDEVEGECPEAAKHKHELPPRHYMEGEEESECPEAAKLRHEVLPATQQS